MSATPDIVVLIPGITGSVLERRGREVWGLSGRSVFEGLRTFGGSIRSLALTGPDDPEADSLGDDVVATQLMPDLHLFPGLGWKIDGYGKIASYLKRRSQLVEGENFFPFPYDWRRDNRVAARRLQRESAVWLKRWRESATEDAKLILVAHSMGGLVARYFVEVLQGWRDTRALITFGTPFYGSLNAVDFLSHGLRRGIGPFKVDLSPLLQSFTSVHELVPVYRCVTLPDGTQVTPANAGMNGWKDEWSATATGFFDEIEKAASDNRADPKWGEAGLRFVPIVGTDQPTNQSAQVDATGKVAVLRSLAGRDRGGDGTVPRVSAALAGTEDVRMFSPERHASLQNLPAILGHVAGVMESFDEIRIGDLRGALLSWFAFDCGEVYASEEHVTFEATVVTDLPEWQLPDVVATVVVTNKDTGEERRREHVVQRERTLIDVGPLPPGAYTVELLPPPASDSGSVRDVFVVVDVDDPGVDAALDS